MIRLSFYFSMICLWLIPMSLVVQAQDSQPPDDREVISAENATQIIELARYGDGILTNALVWSPDGSRIAAGGSLGVWVFEADNRDAKPEFLPHDSWVVDVDWSPDGKVLAVVTRTHQVQLWDLDTLKITKSLSGFDAVKFSPDGRSLAVGGREWDGDSYFNASVNVLDLETGKVTARLIGNIEKYITEISFSPDGRLIAAAHSSEGTGYCFVDEFQGVWLWSLEEIIRSDSEITQINAVQDILSFGFDVDFSEDGKYIPINGIQGISLWSIDVLPHETGAPRPTP